jgi:DNA-directed RNA polymerase subunit RPC12/RpoP
MANWNTPEGWNEVMRLSAENDIRLICANCGACAGHKEDRNDQDRCRHCGERETIIQELTEKGWVSVE